MIIKNISVPTGNILIINGDKNKPIECLSIGDYGKEKNIKADFLGLTREIDGVPNGTIEPLSEKWVITVSTQYGCSMNCKFCEVPFVGPGINVTYNDLKNQIISCLKLHPEVLSTKRLNIHFARMGEPTFNSDVLDISYDLHKIIHPFLGNSLIHPVISTMMPKNNRGLFSFLNDWVVDIKNDFYRGDAGLQFSINSTDDDQRNNMFSNNCLSLNEISKIIRDLEMPKGRKFALNFALADGYIIEPKKLLSLFNPKKCMVKLTPIHNTNACIKNNIETKKGYDLFTPYKQIESELKQVGFDVIVFIPSKEEDESKITCGNAILSEKE